MADSRNLSDVRRNLLETYLRRRASAQVQLKAPIKPRASGNPCPLSFSQQQVWLHSQTASKDIPLYNETFTIHRNGPLHVHVLSRTLDEIVRRHEIWRTTFDVIDGKTVQIVHPPESFDLPTADLRDIPQPHRNEEAVRLASEEARKPFDLREGPLRRALLVQLADDQYRIYFTFHQLIFDGVTAYQVFLPELAAIYEAFLEGNCSPLPDPDIQYADYAIWQLGNSQEHFEKELEYWQGVLKGELPVLEWPLHRPAVRTHAGQIQTFFLGPELLSSLRSLSQQQCVSVFMILVAGLNALLHRYTGQDDIIVGAPTAGRNLAQLQNMLGYFLNLLPLRVDLSGDPTFSELLARVREVVLGALSHQDISFTQLVETIRPTADPSRNAIFQVAISLEPPIKVIDNGWSAQQSDISTGASKLDLYIDIDEAANGIHGPVTYNPDVFDAAEVTSMMEHWCTLLASAAVNPDTRISKLSILSAQERHRVLVEWNKTESEYPRDKCIHQLFAEQCLRTPDAIALLHESGNYTFKALQDASTRLASRLCKVGVLPGSRVALCLERSPEFVIAVMAIFKAGAAYVPLDASYPADRLAFMLQDSHPQAVITTRDFCDKFPDPGTLVLCVDEVFKNIVDEGVGQLDDLSTSGEAAYVIYTSGSTGRPRGVVGTHKACLNRFSWMWREYPFAIGEVCCHKTNLSFVDSIWEIFGPLLAGVPNVIIPQEVVRDPEELLQTLAVNRVTRIVLVPSLLRSLLDQAPNLAERVPDLKLWSCSGEVLTVELANRFRAAHPTARLLNIYGSSEVAADVTCYEVMQPEGRSSVPIGKPISNSQIYILDRNSNPVPPRTRGEIYVGGDGLATGYWRRPDLTQERFIENLVEGAGRLFRTGDLGAWDANGEIEYLGRVDSQVKLRGKRLELGEVEAVLATHSGVKEAAATLIDEGDQQRLIAYLSCADTRAPSLGELRRHMRAKLPEHMVPGGYILLDRLPLLPSGKVDRKVLPSLPGKALTDELEIVSPQTEVQKQLAEMWQELLHVNHVGLDHNFLELGGHSLMVLQLIARVRKTFQVEISVRTVFEQPTISELAVEVHRALAAGKKLHTPVPPWKPSRRQREEKQTPSLTRLDSLPHTDARSTLQRVLDDK